MNANGTARTEINIEDYSVITGGGLKGITGYLGVTQRGVIGKPYTIGSWEEYKLNLGGFVAGNDFPMLCYRALQKKATLVIVPAGKYTNPTDKTTLQGVKATNTQTQTNAAAAGATSQFTITGPATGADTMSVTVAKPGSSDIVIASAVAVANADTATAIATAIVSAINGGTGTHGFSASNAAGAITVTAPSNLGAWGRKLSLRIGEANNQVPVNNYAPAFIGGNDTTVNTGTITIKALEKGTAYNGITVVAQAAASNDPNRYDLIISIPDGTVPQEIYTDIPKAANDANIANTIATILNSSRLIGQLTLDPTYVFQPFSISLATGTDGAALVPADYAGNLNQGTNLRAFDGVAEITKIAIPAIADGTLAKTLADYADERKDLMALHRTPLNLSPDRVLEYRNGTGSYNHQPIDSWRSLMFTGGLSILDPVTLVPRNFYEISDVVGAIAQKDNNYGEWYSFAGAKRGVLTDVLDVLQNVGTAGLRSKADAYDVNGIIPVIKNSAKQILIWGNPTMYRRPSLLQKAEVAELLIYVYRQLNILVPLDTFDPNDTDTWKSIYRRVVPFIQDLCDNRALWNDRNEPDTWYKGDQDVTDVTKAVINTPDNIDKGLYKFKLYLKPKVALKYIEVGVIVTNSGVDFETVN